MQSLSRDADGSARSGSSNVDSVAADTPLNSAETAAHDEALDLFSAEEPSNEQQKPPSVQHRVSEARVVSIPIPVSPRLEVERPSAEVEHAFPEVERTVSGAERPSLEAQRSSYSAPELDLPTESTARAGGQRNTQRLLIIAVIVILSVIAAVQAIFLIRGMPAEGIRAAIPSTGSVSVQSTPAGAAVTVNGQARGVTPLALTLDPGDYRIEVSSGGVSRAVPVTVAAGSSSSQHVLFGADPERLGGLQITSQPAGARVIVDDVPRGVTPLVITDLAPGAHTVVLDGASGPTRQNVTIEPGTTSSIAVTMPAAGASGGFVRVSAPFEVELFENGALIGSSQSERIMLPAGRHVIETVNSTLGYRSTHTVQVSPGASASIRVEAPSVSVDVNAVPWAEVTIAGRTLGTTPLGNVQVPIGAQEVIFRHPQLGERRIVATITARGPNRVSLNMNQK